MKKLRLIKAINSILSVVLVLALNPIKANAEWKQSNTSLQYRDGNSYAKSWREIDGKWYYFDSNGYMKTGWIEVNGLWYYLYPSGEKAFNTVINGFELDENGVWIKESKDADEARNLILKEDSKYISKNARTGAKLSKSYIEGNITKFIANDKWNLPLEEVYVFGLDNSEYEYCGYLVGKTSNNIYCVPHQGTLSIYQIKNDEIVKTYKWLGNDAYPYDWR